jgi:signal transduction histidine kinase
MVGTRGRERVLRVTASRDGAASVLVCVRDSGGGLDDSHRDRIFDAFYTTKPGGLGMGLAISRSIIEAHGGRIYALSNHGAGASICFMLSTVSGES